jgi:two-component system LytT family response regulator
MKIKCLLLDTDLDSVKPLSRLLKQHYLFELTHEYSHLLEAKSILNSEEIQIIFMDTDLGILNAFEFYNSLKNKPMLVLFSSSKDFAYEAFENDAIDYLLKPFSEEKIKNCLEKCIRRIKINYEEDDDNDESVLVKHEGNSIKLALNKITHIKAMGDYITIYMINFDSYMILTTLSKMEKKLPKDIFYRAQRSYIVNLKKITKLNSRSVYINEYEIPLSRNISKAIREAYKKLKQIY